jgi:hypothetical protein
MAYRTLIHLFVPFLFLFSACASSETNTLPFPIPLLPTAVAVAPVTPTTQSNAAPIVGGSTFGMSGGGGESIASSEGGWRDGTDPLFYEPGGISATDGKLYVADTNNHALRVIDIASGETNTLVLKGIQRFLPTADADNFYGQVIRLEPIRVAEGSGEIVLDVASARWLQSQRSGPLFDGVTSDRRCGCAGTQRQSLDCVPRISSAAGRYFSARPGNTHRRSDNYLL